MKEDKKVNLAYADFMRAMDERNKLEKLVDQRNDNRVDIKEKAKIAFRDYAYSAMPKEARPKNAKDIGVDDEIVGEYVNFGRSKLNEKSANLLYQNLESIVDKEMPEESIEKLARAKEIIERASEKEEPVFDAYISWRSSEDLGKRYKEGKKISDEEQKMVNGAAADGLGEKLAEKLKSEGYSTDIQNAIRTLAYGAVQRGHVDKNNFEEYASSGLDKMTKDKKEKYDEAAKKSGTAYDISRDILKRLANGKREEFELARNIIYSVGKKD